MNDQYIPEIVTIQNLCSLMGISRSRYYQLLNDGYILPPVYSIETKRPFYTRAIAEKNISVIKNNIGINGKICLFYYTSRKSGIIPKKVKVKSKKKQANSDNNYQGIIDGLEYLGLSNINPSVIHMILKSHYPNGVTGIDDGEIIRTVYCAISAQNSKDNVNR